MTVLDTISRLQATDETTARLLLEHALYDALCDEVDRITPQLDAEVAKALRERAAQGLLQLAKQPVTKQSAEIADHLIDLVELSKRARGDDWDWHGKDPGERGEDGRFVPKQGGLRRGLLNAMGWATGSKEKSAQGLTRDLGAQWTGPQADNYTRAQSLGRGLVRTNDPNMRPAGTVLRLIGDIGPEAQAALEPGIRRTAYRYRGTERRPDPTTQKRINEISAKLQGPGQDSDRLATLSHLGTAVLIEQIPDRDTAAISLAAGKMPPSVGMMFDGQGRLVSEAQGFNGDHYLPFDLRNLKRLHGGSYVRTRTTGGLTDEDIYTGLMTGARHMTVVSNSGVFTLEFDPSVRGGRRYSDKARQMVDRYSRLVAAIGSGKLHQNQLPPETISQLRREALKASGAKEVDGKLVGGNAATAKTLFEERKKEALAIAAFTSKDEDELLEEAEANAMKRPGANQLSQQGLARAVKYELAELREREAKVSARAYRLDGEGYKAALKALETEFPYFIRSTSYQPLQQYMDERGLGTPGDPRRGRGGTDMGYTRGGELAPASRPRNERLGTRGQAPEGDRPGQPDRQSGSGAPAAAGGAGGAAPAAAGAAQGDLAGVARDMKRTLASRLGQTLTLRNRAHPNWDGVLMAPDMTEEDALIARGHSYAQYMLAKHQPGEIAEKLLTGDERHLEVMDEVLEEFDSLVQPADRASFKSEHFAEARELVRQAGMLRKPFSPAPVDVLTPPEEKNPAPLAFEDIVGIGYDEDKLQEFANGHPEDVAAADQLSALTPKDQADQIAQAIEHLDKLKAWDGTGMPPRGLTESDRDSAVAIAALGDQWQQAPPAQELEHMQRGWALLRQKDLTGLVLGRRVDFTKGVASTRPPSRVVRLSADSPVAKALAAHLASQPSPSLRPVRMPASR